jgi:predicted signal transduction protein with EAL and GGDEF domain
MPLFDFLSGAITLGFIVAGLFFLRFWLKTRDSLFLAFAIAFMLLGAGQAVQALANIPQEERSYIFLIRLAAFTLILAAVLRKNRSSS